MTGDLRRQLGRDDRFKLDEYIDAVRSVERRLEFFAQPQAERWTPTTRPDNPLSPPDNSESGRRGFERALDYMALKPGLPITGIHIDRVFIGSCTNSRIEDLRAAAKVVTGHHVHSQVSAMVVPGSQSVKAQAEREGLDRVFLDAGFEWREPGCSMCLGMNPDILSPGERCASTSNRNFEGRQGAGGRTHLVSPQMAAAAAIAGHFVDVRDWDYKNSSDSNQMKGAGYAAVS